MAWLLVGILISSQAVAVKPFGIFMDMDQCFSARQIIMAQIEKPKINYEFVCVRTNTLEEL